MGGEWDQKKKTRQWRNWEQENAFLEWLWNRRRYKKEEEMRMIYLENVNLIAQMIIYYAKRY